MTAHPGKTRYPACGRALTPHMTRWGLEPLAAFTKRATCNRTCAGALRRQRPVALTEVSDAAEVSDAELRAQLKAVLERHPELVEML